MKILVHDYSGHPFQVQLSRELAAKGHEVLHLYFAGFQTPHGNLTKSVADAPTFSVRGISIGQPFQKDSFIKRRAQEIKYGELVGKEIRDFGPDVVLSANTPLDAQRQVHASAKEVGAAFVFWLQDLIGEAIIRILSKKIPVFGKLVGLYYRRLEMRILRQSDGIIAITHDFLSYLEAAEISPKKVSVVENWAPLDEMPLVEKENEWAAANGFVGRANVVYAGTLGFKHNPSVLMELARTVDATVTVFSQGAVVENLLAAAQRDAIRNLVVKPWVEFADLPKMLAAADVVCALMEPDAGVFSVPSKVLSYLAAGRPILAAIPAQNLAARLIVRENAGFVREPGDDKGFVEAGRILLSSPQMREQMSNNGRRYAEANFDISKIAIRFESILQEALLTQIPIYSKETKTSLALP